MHAKILTTKYRLLAVMFGALFLALGGIGHALAAAPGVIEKYSASDFEQTVQKLKQSVTANKLVLLKDFNHQMMVKMVGVHADKSMAFEVFHPRYGKVINAKDRSAFLVPPLRILVQQDGSKVIVRYQQPSLQFKPYKGLDDLGKELDTLIAQVVDAATK